MLTCLSADTIRVISRFVGLCDLHNLRGSCKDLQRVTTPIFLNQQEPVQHLVENATKRLVDLFDDKFTEFTQLLEDAKGVISGSFLVKCSTGMSWDSDVDIYIPNTDASSLAYEPLEDFLYNCPDSWIDPKTRFNCNGGDERSWSGYDDTSHYEPDMGNDDLKIRCVRSYKIKGKVIQIMHLGIPKSIEHTIQFINATFDFDLCKNIYYIKDGIPRAIIGSARELSTKHF